MKNLAVYQVYLRTFTKEGTLKAAEKKIPHIADLGFDIIYLSALNKADDDVKGQSPRQIESGMNNPKNPYRIVDYFEVDEEYGTIEDLKSFIETAHKNNLKVLIDLVYLHCGQNAVFIKDNPDFVVRNEDGTIKIGDGWPFARLNYENEQLREYLWSNMEFYIKHVNADGFRCDVGCQVPRDFWEEGTKRIREINPDAIMLDEGELPDYISAFDWLYGFSVLRTINRTFFNEKNSGKPHFVKSGWHDIPEDDDRPYNANTIKDEWLASHKEVPEGRYLIHVNNHDVASDGYNETAEAFLGQDGVDAMLGLVFTLNGIPMIYNGDEIADDSPKNMFWNRFCDGDMSVKWEKMETENGQRRMNLIKNLISMRKQNKAVSCGRVKWIEHSNEENILGFSREFEGESVKVFINVTSKNQTTKADNIGHTKILIQQNSEIKSDEIILLPYGFVIYE